MSAAYDWMDYSERMLRTEIEKIPDGTYGPVVGWLDVHHPCDGEHPLPLIRELRRLKTITLIRKVPADINVSVPLLHR